MKKMRNVPKPNFKYNATRLVKLYKRAAEDIMREIERSDLTQYSANSRALLADISEIIVDLDDNAEKWVKENIPKSAREGVARSLVTLEIASSMEEAEKIVKFNKINRELVQAAVADTYQDIAYVTQNINRKTKAGLRKAFADTIREQYTQGVTGLQTIKRETLNKMYSDLEGLTRTGITDAAGRKWRAETYVEMVAQEKMNQAYFEANTNEAIARGAFYGIISSHGATDACRYHEGRIVKLTEDAPGDYPTVEELEATGQIFHINCGHHVSTLRNLDILPASVLDKAEKQARLGEKAVSEGGRNPDVE